MIDINISTLENLKAWLAGRTMPDGAERATVGAPESLRSIGFADLILEKAGPEHQETIISALNFDTQKPKKWTELCHFLEWSSEFVTSLRNNRNSLAALELLRGANEYPITLARFHVDECINVVTSAINFEVGLNIQHPDTRAQNYAVSNILVDDSICLQDMVRQVFSCLTSKCVARLVVKTNCFYSAVLTAYLVDLMHSSGATLDEVSCIAFERRESIGNERFSKPISPNKSSKLSVVAAVFRQTDTFAAAQGIIDSYFREMYPNLIILVEESAYERFAQDWQRYYSHAIHIGSRLDDRTTVVDTFNSKVQIDLAAIDLKAAHKMSGNVINVLRFRTVNELMSLLGNLRKIPFMSIWNDDVLLSREFCMRLNSCNEFWLNHVPKSLAGHRFAEDVLNYYYDSVAEDMTYIFNSIDAQYSEEVEQLRKMQASFVKKDSRIRNALLFHAIASILSKYKSLRNGSTVEESIYRLKRFQRENSLRIASSSSGGSRIETIVKPVGLAIILVREDSSVKNKPVLLELIFKNLVLGNAVLLTCPPNTLVAKFAIDNDHVIPFKMIHEPLPDISRLSLDASLEFNETTIARKRCPKNTYAIEVLAEMNSEICEAITIALGSRRKSIWVSEVEQADYWSNE